VKSCFPLRFVQDAPVGATLRGHPHGEVALPIFAENRKGWEEWLFPPKKEMKSDKWQMASAPTTSLQFHSSSLTQPGGNICKTE